MLNRPTDHYPRCPPWPTRLGRDCLRVRRRLVWHELLQEGDHRGGALYRCRPHDAHRGGPHLRRARDLTITSRERSRNVGFGLDRFQKHHYLIRLDRRSRKLIHGRATRAGHDACIIEPTRVHAGAAQENLSIAGKDALEHTLNIVIAVWRLLAGLAATTESAMRKTVTLVSGAFFMSAWASRSAL